MVVVVIKNLSFLSQDFVSKIGLTATLERKYDDGPEYLASELAYPQALRQLFFSLVSFVIAVRWLAEDAVLEFPPRAVLDPEAQNVQILLVL